MAFGVRNGGGEVERGEGGRCGAVRCAMRLEAVGRLTQRIHEAIWQSWAATMTGA